MRVCADRSHRVGADYPVQNGEPDLECVRVFARTDVWIAAHERSRATESRARWSGIEGGCSNRGYAASWYSWISPPSRSRRLKRSRSITSASVARTLSGGRCPSVRCGRCALKPDARDEHMAEVATAEDQQPVEALAADAANPALRVRSRFPRPHGRLIPRMPSERKTSSKSRVNLPSRSRTRTRGRCPRRRAAPTGCVPARNALRGGASLRGGTRRGSLR
jgi:hypothetical protein